MATRTSPEVRWLTDAEQLYWRAFVDGTARLNEALGRRLEQESGLSLHEYEVLVRLSEIPDRTMRMSVLADELARSRSWLTHTVRRMEESGLVERVSCPADGRGVNCVMTDLGYEELTAASPGHVEAVRRYVVDRLSPEQLRSLGEAMAMVRAGLRSELAPG